MRREVAIKRTVFLPQFRGKYIKKRRIFKDWEMNLVFVKTIIILISLFFNILKIKK